MITVRHVGAVRHDDGRQWYEQGNRCHIDNASNVLHLAIRDDSEREGQGDQADIKAGALGLSRGFCYRLATVVRGFTYLFCVLSVPLADLT